LRQPAPCVHQYGPAALRQGTRTGRHPDRNCRPEQVPFYNADITDKPAAVQQLLAQLAQADALLLACPEYNYSMAPALKNALDWASREPDNKLLAGKAVAILGAGGGMGTSRAQYHLRQSCVFSTCTR
jgi:chromate reductase